MVVQQMLVAVAVARPASLLAAWRRRARGLDHHAPTPLKVAHLEHSPCVSCSYWDPTHDVAIAECVADAAVKQHAWDLFRAAPEPLGHDPYAIWPDGTDDPDVLRLTPWRLRVAGMETLLGKSAPLVWRA